MRGDVAAEAIYNVRMQVLRLIIISLCLTAPLSAHAGFFDDLFGTGDKVELQSYSIDLRDIDGAETIVSHEEKVLKLKIYYPKADATKIDELTNPQLKAAVQDALTVTTVDSESGDETDLNDLNFAIRFKQVSTKSDQFYEMQFLSQGTVLDTPQRLEFSFNAKQFTRLLNLDTDPDEDRYTDKIYVKPIVIELEKASLEALVTTQTASLVTGYSFKAEFTDNKGDFITTNITSDDLEFTYKTNGLTKVATAKASAKSKPVALDISADSVSDIFTLYDDDTGTLNLPVTIEPAVDFIAGRSYNVRVPLQIETQTASGLKVLLRGVAKGQIDTAPVE